MKQTPDEKRNLKNFQPGKLSKEGFLGNDTRHIHDIIRDDAHVLEKYHVTKETIADELKKMITIGKQGLECDVETENYTVHIQWDRGMISCPFGEPGLHPKLMAVVKVKDSGKEIRFSQLCVHLIQKHGFFGGLGSVFRVDPEFLCQILEKNISDSTVK